MSDEVYDGAIGIDLGMLLPLRAHAREAATGRSCKVSVVMQRRYGAGARPRIARNGHWRGMARSGDRRIRRRLRAAGSAALAPV